MEEVGGGVGRGAPREQTNRINAALATCAVTFHSHKMMQQYREGMGGGRRSCWRGSEPIAVECRCYGVGTKVKGTE